MYMELCVFVLFSSSTCEQLPHFGPFHSFTKRFRRDIKVPVQLWRLEKCFHVAAGVEVMMPTDDRPFDHSKAQMCTLCSLLLLLPTYLTDIHLQQIPTCSRHSHKCIYIYIYGVHFGTCKLCICVLMRIRLWVHRQLQLESEFLPTWKVLYDNKHTHNIYTYIYVGLYFKFCYIKY